ncbi:SPFH domain-containing protein [Weissella confusa]|uniref:SPFH domain-containing protein n=1 Tax=Weissella confusa TaxID=1583 RepID=UPI000DCA8AB0|nr:SPFH domain-containing protein [Weissella confusa]MBD1490455.1 SPFH/Band 7/PHB domain protein [Weissella confusa]MBD5832517.1 paraslipin [Weissella confusa]MBF7057809.1 SPFH/Band 7/PHB domain protein [Weissella confusa]MBJ7621485.1 SPFH/Band 7/PHB domain protein [Weissella confusa]MBJ7630130.1 SPFH/Band 7/PHB domain protein [Weissella confusa]
MILFSVLIVLLLIILAFVVFTGIRIIPQNMVGMVSVLGKYQRQIQPGLHVVMPFITRVDRVDLAQVPLRLSEQSVISRDNAEVIISLSLNYHVTDPYKFTFENADSVKSMVQQSRAHLRGIIGTMDLNEVLNGTERINAALSKELGSITDAYGVNVDRINIDTIQPTPEIQESMNKQINATREREAAIARAEGEARSIELTTKAQNDALVSTAEANAKAVRLAADAEAYRIQKANDILSTVDANYLVAQNIDAFRDVAKSPANTVIVPNTAIDALGELKVAGQLLNTNHK